MAECIHGIQKYECSVCKNKKRKIKFEIAKNPFNFPSTKAKYNGWCKSCGMEIGEGDMIYNVDGLWVDESCMEEA